MRRLKCLIYRLGYPLVKVYWFLRRPGTSGVGCIITHGEKLLLVRHSYGSPLLTTVGGGIKKNESPKEAVLREVQEEVGIVLEDALEIGIIFYEGEFKRDTIHFFIANSKTSNLKMLDGEILEADWYKMSNLPDDLSPLFKKFLHLADPHLATNLSVDKS